MTATLSKITATEFHWLVEHCKAPKIRTMREFAEQEIVIPDGPYEGRRFRVGRQPYTALLYDAIDSGNWNRFVTTGPTQSGKSLSCFVIPTLYHLFEIGETVICGLPDINMASDKWREDLLPAIERSNFRDLLPKSGAGSRGGKIDAIQFRNGATLKFMSGGGGDKSRAGFTARVIVITETDGLDSQGAASREADKLTQIEARSRSFGNRKRIYMECTVSTEEGRTWKEYEAGTKSRIVLRCPHCSDWVSPEREHLFGWQEAKSKMQAMREGHFVCPSCSKPWSEDDRAKANQTNRLLHGEQRVSPKQKIVGELPETDTLGFRWSAVNNLFQQSGDIAADEWRAARSADEDNAEREMRQFVWTLPVEPTKWAMSSLSATLLAGRIADWSRGIVPADAVKLTSAMDLGKYLTHWVVVAWLPDGTSHLVDYGRIEVPSNDFAVEKALGIAMDEYRDMVESGWLREGAEDEKVIAGQAWVDAGNWTSVVKAWCKRHGSRYLPSFGRGVDQFKARKVGDITGTGSKVMMKGEHYQVHRLKEEKQNIVIVESDEWKSWVHARLETPLDQPGHMTFFSADAKTHFTLAKHLTAEEGTEEFLPGKGVVTKWERIRRDNHWFDALYNACAAGHSCGVRLLRPAVKRKPRKKQPANNIPRETSKHHAQPRKTRGGWINRGRRIKR